MKYMIAVAFVLAGCTPAGPSTKDRDAPKDWKVFTTPGANYHYVFPVVMDDGTRCTGGIMSLPPLPEPGLVCNLSVYYGIAVNKTVLDPLFGTDQMREYGALCRKMALEEAARVCDEMQQIPASEPRHCAQDIRGLK